MVKIHVVYCGAWGYKPKFDRLKDAVLQQFDSKMIEMTGEGTPGATGFFEVEVEGDLVHSKKNGDGYVDSDPKLEKIMNAIEAKIWRWNEETVSPRIAPIFRELNVPFFANAWRERFKAWIYAKRFPMCQLISEKRWFLNSVLLWVVFSGGTYSRLVKTFILTNDKLDT